jgi:protein-S-isoprenylcysteine O-methyltransferase Ste14
VRWLFLFLRRLPAMLAPETTVPRAPSYMRILSAALRYIDAFIFTAFTAFVIAQRDYSVRFRIGMSIAALGIALWAVARIQLGSSFAITAQAKKLVITGLYSKVRNPIYVFGGIGYVGLFITLGNWPALALFVVLYSYQIARVKKEERVLEQTFGERYRRYKAGTWF